MAIKRKGIVAAPGEYKYGDMTEIKTADELKLAAERQPIIMLTKGHPIDGVPLARDVIGTVSQKWDPKTEKVTGEFWFHDEKTPENIKKKLMNYEPIPISAGILIDNVSDGIQEGIVYTHMAILDGEDPKCPLGTCGINIRMESEPTKNARFEQKTELDNVPKEVEEPLELDDVDMKTLDEVVEEETPKPEIPKTEEPAEQKPEAEVAEPVKEEVKLEPEVIIPVGQSTVQKEFEVDERGWVTFIPQRYKKTETK